MGINDCTKFDFMDQPTLCSLNHALEVLHSLSAVTEAGAILTFLVQPFRRRDREHTAILYKQTREIYVYIHIVSIKYPRFF